MLPEILLIEEHFIENTYTNSFFKGKHSTTVIRGYIIRINGLK
jgi:hypothetical protein